MHVSYCFFICHYAYVGIIDWEEGAHFTSLPPFLTAQFQRIEIRCWYNNYEYLFTICDIIVRVCVWVASSLLKMAAGEVFICNNFVTLQAHYMIELLQMGPELPRAQSRS